MRAPLFVLAGLCVAAAAVAQPAGTPGYGPGPFPPPPATIVYPETYGAVGNAATFFDGTVASTFTAATGAGTSTGPSAPSITTVTNNDLVLRVYAVGATWSAAPAAANTRQNVGFIANAYGMYVGDQTVASAGGVSSLAGTLNSSAGWGAATIPLTTSTSISFVAASNYQSGTTGPITLTKPVGTAAGDYLVVCVANFAAAATNATILAMPQGFQEIVGFNNSNNPNVTCWGKVATSGEPSSYTITYNYNSTAGETAVMLDYRGVSSPENISKTLTSATAAFPSSAVGYGICIASVYGASQQQQECGTITAVNSPTSANVSFNLPVSVSGVQFAYGKLDTAAFTAMLAAAPCGTVGCTVVLGMKHYALDGSLTLPPNLPISLVGQGPGIPNTSPSYVGGSVPLSDFRGGTQLQWLAQSLTQAAITVGGALHLTNTAASNVIRDLTVVAGVGIGNDGGGANGIALLNTQNVQLQNIHIDNFYGVGVYIDGMAASNIKDWIDGIRIENILAENNAFGGVQIGSALAVQNLSAFQILDSFLMGNGGPGISAVGANIQGLRIHGNTLAWNNTLGFPRQPEIAVSGRVGGGVFEGNYVEADGLYGSGSTGVISGTVGTIGIRFGSNYYSNNGFTWPTFSAAGTPLTACSNNNYINHAHATVTDATSGVAGTTYTSGGTVRADMVCNGTNWIATGTVSY